MRPPEFTGGNTSVGLILQGSQHLASMRPPEFTGGNNTRLSTLNQSPSMLQ